MLSISSLSSFAPSLVSLTDPGNLIYKERGVQPPAIAEKGQTTMFTQTPGRRRLLLRRRSAAGFLAGVFLFALVGPALAAGVTLAAGAFFKGGHQLIKPGTAIDGVVQHDTLVRVGAP